MLGNFDEHFDQIKEAEWIIEVVVENLEIKQQLMEKIEKVADENAVITTNTSGLPIQLIAKDRSDGFKKRFFGTHFFNPPRYLSLLEVIPTPDADPDILERVKWFGGIHLGKSIVIAKDTPNFIANRIGTYAIMQAIREFTNGNYTIEEIDALTGSLIGHPKSATFRTVDVVGLDTLVYVGENLFKAIPDDESRDAHRPPDLMKKLIENGMLGQKRKKGFYQKIGKDILSINPDTLEYQPPKEMNLGDIKAFSKIGSLPDRIRAVYDDSGRAGQFTRQTMLDIIGYSARRIPEIADNPADIDKAICWGFGWEMGPFATWDALGFEKVINDMVQLGIDLPEWIEKMKEEGAKSFYRQNGAQREVYIPGKGYIAEFSFPDVIDLSVIKTQSNSTLFEREEAALLDIGDKVALYEFRSKANTLGSNVVEGIYEAIDHVENNDYYGLVIGNSGKNFSVGANLYEASQILLAGKFDEVENLASRFQAMVKRIRYARKPVVSAVQGMVLGGGCEVVMASANVVAALETYMGLVELGAGLIPAGCGTTNMTAWATESAASEFPSHIQPFMMNAFQTIATAKIATSAFEAKELGFLKPDARVVMNNERRLYVAKEEVIRMANEGYLPPPVRTDIVVLGETGRAAMDSAVYQMQQAGFATEYDKFLAAKLSYIMNGGDITAPTPVHEDYLQELEIEVFLSLLKEKKTLERVESIIKTNKPLRN
jgi:3-hydroxyacyl-CoA dehydrogenase